MRHKHVRPLVARIPRRKTEREVWAPNFFPELSRVRAATRERFDWRKAAALLTLVALLSTIQVGRDGGIPQAVADVAGAADSVADSVVAAVIDPEREPETIGSKIAGTEQDAPRAGKGDESIAPSDRKKLKALLAGGDPTMGSRDKGSSGGIPETAPGSGKIAWAKGDVTAGIYSTDLWVMDPDGSNHNRLTANPDTLELWPSWSPDGTYIAYVIVRPPNPTTQDLWVMDADGSNKTDLGLCPGVGRCGKLAWSPDGRRVAYGQGTDLWVTDLARGTRELLVAGQIREPNPALDGRGSGPTWSPDGKSLAFECGDDLCVVGADGGEPRVIGPALGDPDWSPGGDLLVGEDWPDSSERATDLVIHRLDGNDRRWLTRASEHSGVLRFPSWAPDGEAIVYTDETSLYRVERDGTDRVKLTSGERDLMPDWGPSS